MLFTKKKKLKPYNKVIISDSESLNSKIATINGPGPWRYKTRPMGYGNKLWAAVFRPRPTVTHLLNFFTFYYLFISDFMFKSIVIKSGFNQNLHWHEKATKSISTGNFFFPLDIYITKLVWQMFFFFFLSIKRYKVA